MISLKFVALIAILAVVGIVGALPMAPMAAATAVEEPPGQSATNNAVIVDESTNELDVEQILARLNLGLGL
jgi:hypothetical protein